MILMRGLIRLHRQVPHGSFIAGAQHVPRSPQELRRFQNHLDNVAVAVPLGGETGVHRQKEDVHGLLGLCHDNGNCRDSNPVQVFTAHSRADAATSFFTCRYNRQPPC